MEVVYYLAESLKYFLTTRHGTEQDSFRGHCSENLKYNVTVNDIRHQI
jgi:hypothetical protein